MRAIEFNEKIVINNNFEKPVPPKGEALIRVLKAGICNTDIEITKGYMGFKGILGHEFVGIVEEINDEDKSLLNKRVVGEINCGCGVCGYCKQGLERHCMNRSCLGIWQRNGCMADYITLPIANLLEVSPNVTDEEATFVEPIAAAFEINEQINIRPDYKVLILGDGKLGLLISLVLNLSQADVTLVGKHEDKLNIAKAQGVKTKLLDELGDDRIYDVVVEATGTINGFESALKLVKPRGIIVLKSTVAATKEINLAPIVIDEITVVGSRCGQFAPAVKVLERKLIDVKPLITKVFGFNEAESAFELACTKGTLKVLLDFSGNN